MELLVNGVAAATSMTGGDGRALLPFVPTSKGIVPVQVRVGASPRVSAAEAHANLVVWERRTPVLVVELSSLIEDTAPKDRCLGIGLSFQQDLKPMADAAEETGQTGTSLLRDHVCRSGAFGADVSAISTDTRNWLATHKLPLVTDDASTRGRRARGEDR